MTAGHWKLYTPDQTYELFRRAEYKKNEQTHKAEVYRVATATAQSNLSEARQYLEQAEATVVKLKTAIADFANGKNPEADKTKKQNELYVEGKQALEKEKAIEIAKRKAEEAADAKKDKEAA
jgi:hypothetical protein